MACRSEHPLSRLPQGERRKDAPALAKCPLCNGKMNLVYNRNHQQVVVCEDCRSGLTVPNAAWDVVRAKREAK